MVAIRSAEMEKMEMTIEHAKASLANVQGNIRHIDTKVAGAMGLVAVVLGFCISRSVLANQLRFSAPVSLWYRIPTVLLLFAAVAFLIVAIWYASKTLFPRMTTDPRLKDKKWMLFPIAGTDAEAVVLRDTLWEASSKGMSAEKILEEYVDQLAVLGHIQTQKMNACEALFKWVAAFCAVMLALGGMSLLCYVQPPFHIHAASACPHEGTVTANAASMLIVQNIQEGK